MHEAMPQSECTGEMVSRTLGHISARLGQAGGPPKDSSHFLILLRAL